MMDSVMRRCVEDELDRPRKLRHELGMGPKLVYEVELFVYEGDLNRNPEQRQRSIEKLKREGKFH